MDPTAPSTRNTLLSTYWRDPEYLTYVPLTPFTALDYFSRSVFFDASSNNEILRMQSGGGGVGVTHRSPKELETELKRFKGVEFVLLHWEMAANHSEPFQPQAGGRGFQYVADDSLFVLCKRRRESAVVAHTLETYYILNGNVHMAPDLQTVLQNRLINSLHSLQKSLSIARDNQYRPILPPSATADKNKGSNVATAAPTLGAQAETAAQQEQQQNTSLATTALAPDADEEDEDLGAVAV